MNPNEAAAALAGVTHAERKLATHARWPFHRHAMFGLAEGLIVAAPAQPIAVACGLIAASMALVVVCVADDKRRHGMFVSGWVPGATRGLTWLLVLFMIAMISAAILMREWTWAQPIGLGLGLFTFAVTTAMSFRWERIYRTQLEAGR